MPYFSLILPIYNVAPYLERCIASILAQSFKDYEIVLVDDGSTDASSQICDTFARSYSNIRVIHKINGGLSTARNAGFEIAEGEYIWWIDSDDWIEKGALEELYIASSSNAPDIVKFQYYRVEKTCKEVISNIKPGSYVGREKISTLLDRAFHLSGNFLLSACMHIYKRDFLKSVKTSFISERIVGSEDYLFNLTVLARANSVLVLSKPLYFNQMREGSLTQTYKKDLPERYERLYKMLLEEYRSRGLLNKYQEGIAFFYVWHLIRGICMTHEYQELFEHSFNDGRRNVKIMLRSSVFHDALTKCNIRLLSTKQKVILIAMKFKMEPFFYYLYVSKPKQRGIHGN